MRPTGPLHLGHLAGALRNWVALQDSYDCFYMVADWHALMSEYAAPAVIVPFIRESVADWIAVGLDPDRSAIFRQSDVREHAELHLILSLFTPLPWLERCPTYKEQLSEITGRDLMTYGFLGYPVLQAADILLYRAEAVPVGKDQVPHLELTREIARRFNGFYGPVFPEPQAILTAAPKVLGLDNRKMSKSYGNFIALADPPETVAAKVRSMITDPTRIRLADPGHPEVCSVFSYWGGFAPSRSGEVESWCRSARVGCTECKARLAQVLSGILAPIREKRREVLAGDRVEKILRAGAERARAAASETMTAVRRAMGV
jgi:tryptophanyl-tRNA synthetase